MIDEVSGSRVGRTTVCYGDSTAPAGGELVDQVIQHWCREYDPRYDSAPKWVLDQAGSWDASRGRVWWADMPHTTYSQSHSVDLLVRVVSRGDYCVAEWVCLGVSDLTRPQHVIDPLPTAPDRDGLDAAVLTWVATEYGDLSDMSAADVVLSL